MPRTCTICAHPEREAIEKALIAGDLSYRHIASQFSVSTGALQRHKKKHLPGGLIKAQEVQEQAQAINVMAELARTKERVDLLFDACDRWLRDPDDPSRYEIGPRAEDIKVTYWETVPGGKPVRRKERLSTILERVNINKKGNLDFELVETKHADPRDLVLKAANQLQRHLELIARLLGELQDQSAVNVLVVNPEWLQVRTVILQALDPFPDARLAVAEALDGNN